MTSLKSNLVKRIERLPKPSNVAGALQPLFEAISNSIHSTQERFGDAVGKKGKVRVEINTNRAKSGFWATVEDNGVGLNDKNWDAFTTTDTDNKLSIGGKGVGRLMWLDCFEKISIQSTYKDGATFRRKSFEFQLSNSNQIVNLKDDDCSASEVAFFVRFDGLRNNGYKDKFPGRDTFVFQHFASHFLPTFIGGKSPSIEVIVGTESRTYPDAIADIVQVQSEPIEIDTPDYGSLKFTMMACDKVASADLKGKHFIHFIAHDRTVHSQRIDSLLGLSYFGPDSGSVFHGILTGDFLDKNVNQERTAFVFEDVVIDRIVNNVCYDSVEEFLQEPLAALRGQQKDKIEQIAATYPSVAFGDVDELQRKVPSGELSEDAIYGHLARERYRRDERQAEKIRDALQKLKEGKVNRDTFAATLAEAGSAIEEAEQRSLAEYIVRRKVVLEFIELLLEKVRNDSKDSSFQREDLLHSFICPMRASSVGDDKVKIEAAPSHDLWIVDERLTFAQYFSSDTEFKKLADAFESDDRPDLLVFDYVHGLRENDDASKVLLIEFKRPGRDDYSADENPQHQVERYVRRLQSGALKDVRGRPIKLNKNTIYYCYIIADIVGKLDDWTYSWQRTVDGRGRIYHPNSGFVGSIELIGWDELISDAKSRNQAFFDRAGISGRSFFSPD